MKNFLRSGVLAAAGLSLILIGMPAATAGSLDDTGFAPNEPISVTGYTPTLVPQGDWTRAADGGAASGKGYEVNGAVGDKAGLHNNHRTNFQTTYDESRVQRFTGENAIGTSGKTHQSTLQNMLRGPDNLMTQTGLMAPASTSRTSFAGPYSCGFTGNSGSIYHGAYNSLRSGGLFGNPLPAVGTGSIELNTTINGYK